MRLALVAMPWTNFDMPSPALGALAAIVRRDGLQCDVTCHYAYLEVWDELRTLYEDIARDDRMGELLYAALLFVERRPNVASAFAEWIAADPERVLDAGGPDVVFEETAEMIWAVLDAHLDALADELTAGEPDVVGLTTSYCQLFASVNLARRLKGRGATPHITLGGMGVPYDVGPSVLRLFPSVDSVVQGEGEERLMVLLRHLESGSPLCEGVLTRAQVMTSDPADDAEHMRVLAGEVPHLDALPIPDYTEYVEAATRYKIIWTVPIEGSRGCWWDRVKHTGDPMNTCYFCSLNTSSYRHKSVSRLVREIEVLSNDYENLRFRFLDNIVRYRGAEDLGRAIAALGRHLSFFYELRAQISPLELLELQQAGCDTVQIGIEGLSTAYLKRIGKGTSTIQNLQVMKTCYELGIFSGSNLLTEFPGTTDAEVAETVEHIERFASAYQPLQLVAFDLYINNTVFRMPERFGVHNIRNADAFRAALPESIWEQIRLYWKDFDVAEGVEKADWNPVRQAVIRWRRLHQQPTSDDGDARFLAHKPLSYRDGGSFLEITDRRGGGIDRHQLRSVLRDLYLYCMQIRSRRELLSRFEGELDTSTIDQVLNHLVEEDLMFCERGLALSLAVAERSDLAAARIRSMASRD
jgi:ribosomal peptide maturation radical SAM protein 1